MSWAELGDKFRDCADLVIPRRNADEAIQLIARIEQMKSLTPLVKILAGDKQRAKKTEATKSGVKGGAVFAKHRALRQRA
jgi:hypothetical protein